MNRLLTNAIQGIYLTLTIYPLAHAQVANITPQRQASLPSVFKSVGDSFPRAENGYFVAIPRTLRSGRLSGSINITGTAGGSTTSLPISLNSIAVDATTARFEDAVVTASRSIALVGSYDRADGPLVATSSFLAMVDPTGTPSLIDTGPYTPVRVCQAPDGTLWTLGEQDRGEALHNLKYDILRHYSTGGNLLGSYLPRRTLHPSVWPLNMHSRQSSASIAYLSCGSASVGAYIGAASLWFELDLSSGNSVAWHSARLAQPASITSLALLGSHSVYATVALHGPATPDSPQPGLYHLVNTSGTDQAAWVRVSPPAVRPNSTLPNLLRISGTDSGSLVVVGGIPTGGNVSWIKP